MACFDPSGRRTRTISVPVPRPTDICFGDSDGRTLFVTTARVRLSPRVLAEAPLSGEIIAYRMAAGGLPPTLAAI